MGAEEGLQDFKAISILILHVPDAMTITDHYLLQVFENKALMLSNKHFRIAGFWDINWSPHKNGLEKFLINGEMKLLIGHPNAKFN